MIKNHRLIRHGKKLFTLSLVSDKLRYWDPYRSKLCALIHKIDDILITDPKSILYLGGGHGTTVSHLSDLFPLTRIFVVEFGPSMMNILQLAQERGNIFPIMENAEYSHRYTHVVMHDQVDLLYQDLSQKNQLDILLRNLAFLKTGSPFILMLKIRSIEQERSKPEVGEGIYQQFKEVPTIEIRGFQDMAPYQKDHYAFWGRRVGFSGFEPPFR